MTNDPYGQYGSPRYPRDRDPYAPQHGYAAPDQPQDDQYPQHGHPQHGHPQHGQPQHGHPQHGQPQYGQPQYGQPGAEDPTGPVTPPSRGADHRGADHRGAGYGGPGYGSTGYGSTGYGSTGHPGAGAPTYEGPGYGGTGDSAHEEAGYGGTEGYGGSHGGSKGYGSAGHPGGGTGYGSAGYGSAGYGSAGYGAPGAPSTTWGPPPAPAPARPSKSRQGLVIGLVAGGLVLVLCLGGVAVVGFRVLADNVSPGASGGPFDGIPAAGFAEGAGGIQMPEAEAVGDFTSGQVADALAQVEQALIAARLDPAMVVDRDPETFLELIAPDQRPFLEEEFDAANFGHFASQIADGAELTPDPPRVEGEVTYEATTVEDDIRMVEVVTSFVWVYAFVVPEEQGLDGVVVIRDELVWQMPHVDDVLESSLGLWLWDGQSYAWGIDCEQYEQSLLAPQTEPRSGPGGPDGDQVFDPEGPLDLDETC